MDSRAEVIKSTDIRFYRDYEPSIDRDNERSIAVEHNDWTFDQGAIDMRQIASCERETAVCVYTGFLRVEPYYSVVFYNRGSQKVNEEGDESDGDWRFPQSENAQQPGAAGLQVFQSHPTIAFDPVHRYEVVIFEDRNATTGRTGLRCGRRTIVPGSAEPYWVAADVVRSDDADFVNPNLWFDSDTFYITYTKKSANLRQVRLALSTNGGMSWERPGTVISGAYAGADSSSIQVRGNRARVLFHDPVDQGLWCL